MPKKFILIILTFLLVIGLALPAMAYRPQDVTENHWALKYISPLLDEGIMYVYENEDFKPSQPITRGEFAYSLAKALKLQPAIISEMTDITNHPSKGYISALVKEGIITGYPDQTFRPYNKITRAEIITMLGRSLGLDEEEKKIEINNNVYYDVTKEHWASNLISLATKLKIINGYPDGNFKPNNYVTRAESAKLLVKLKDLTLIEGQVIETYPLSRKVKVKSEDRIKTFNIASQSLIGRNNRLVDLDEMLVSDNAYLILDNTGQVVYLKAYGLITKDDIAHKVSNLTGNTFTGEELKAIAEGNWDAVTPRLRQELTMTLMEEGLTINEIQAILNQNWNQLEKSGKERLIEAVSLTTNIPREIVRAVSNKDWELAKELSKTTAIKTAIREIMSNSSLLS